jgi:hypothetical protein
MQIVLTPGEVRDHIASGIGNAFGLACADITIHHNGAATVDIAEVEQADSDEEG